MKGRSPGLVDWRSASTVGRNVAGAGPSSDHVSRELFRQEMSEAVATAESLVSEFTGLSMHGPTSRAWVMGRGDWIDANLRSLERSIEPMLVRTIAAAEKGRPPGGLRTKALGAQIGGLFGYLSRKVLGQFDPFLPPDDEGLIYFVGPNILDAEQRFALAEHDFRLWLALHEVTHRVQFSEANWLRGHVLTMLDSYLKMTDLDPRRIVEDLRRVAEDVRGASQWRTIGVVYALMTPPQREQFHRMQAMMSLIEGHATFTMNKVADGRIATLDRMRVALAQRRGIGGFERVFQQAIGFDHKIKQYGVGEAFVAHVVERAGMEGLNRAWLSPSYLPSADEMSEPDLWLARVL
jgi:coenzyme F420 biosynthesis associated uncharacterized protein